jgi:hypothetical protein
MDKTEINNTAFSLMIPLDTMKTNISPITAKYKILLLDVL